MTISITWATGVIYVPKADMTLIQSVPTVIYELNIDDFRLILKSLEDDVAGIGFQKTHDHNTAIDVGGVTLARVVNILEPYTITFEDDQYAVNLVGANSNIGDRVNVNQVSVRSFNSAGLTSSAAIEFSSFNEGVTIDITSEFVGTTFPIGTLQAPVNNLDDALLIAEVRGFDKLYIIGDYTFDVTDDISNFTVYGNHVASTFTLGTPICLNTIFREARLTGTLNGGNQKIEHCEILSLINFSGVIRDSVIRGNIVLDGTETVDILNSFSGVSGSGTPEIDMGGSGRGLSLRAYSGGLKITNLSGAENTSIDFVSGQLKLAADVTAGTFVVRGVGIISEDLSTGTATVDDTGLTNPGIVWDVIMADHLTDGTTGKKLYDGGTGDTAAIAAAVWDELLAGHTIEGSAGEYLTEFYNALARGEVYVATSTATEILMVRRKLGDAGVEITETMTDEEAISESTTVVFPVERMLYSVSSVYLASDPTHAGTEYFGTTGTFDTYTGAITLETALPDDNTQVLVSYTMTRGLSDDTIDMLIDEAKLYVEDYTKETFDWSQGVGVDRVTRTAVALNAAITYATMRGLEAIATGDIVQLGYEFRFGDLEVNNQVTGGFHVQAHIDLLKSDVDRMLSILGRKMTFVMRSTKSLGRDAWGYKRSQSGRRPVY